MATAVDTNILVGFLKTDDPFNAKSQKALETALSDGRVLICGAAYAELLAMPGCSEGYINSFLTEIGLEIDWNFDGPVWQTAGRAFSKYAGRRRNARAGHPRRILTDFLIGAHAVTRGYSLLTMDDRLFRIAFPELELIRV